MGVVIIDAEDVPRGYYARELIENGHIPGMLSQTNLKGKAKQYSKFYRCKRDEVEGILWDRYAVRSGRVKINSRWCRVWVDNFNMPVKLVIEGKE